MTGDELVLGGDLRPARILRLARGMWSDRHTLYHFGDGTKEQFNRIFKIYEEYEVLIKANGMTNGEVDIAIRIIREAYENHMRDHTFIEDIRGYNV